MEIWKDVAGYEDYYQASNIGRVRSKDRVVTKFSAICGKVVEQHYSGRVLKGIINSDGYHMVHIGVNNKKTSIQVGRMVLLAFAGFPVDGQECCHNNGVPSDNRIENLRWDSHLENNRDRIKHGTYASGSSHPMSVLSESDVVAICGSSERGCDLAKKYGVHETIISDIRKRRTWRAVTEKIEIKDINSWKKSEKMTHEKAAEARLMRKKGAKIKDIAAHFGVSDSTMSSLLSGKTWNEKRKWCA